MMPPPCPPAIALRAQATGDASVPVAPHIPRRLAMANECNPFAREAIPRLAVPCALTAAALLGGTKAAEVEEPMPLAPPLEVPLLDTFRMIGNLFFFLGLALSTGLPRVPFTARK